MKSPTIAQPDEQLQKIETYFFAFDFPKGDFRISQCEVSTDIKKTFYSLLTTCKHYKKQTNNPYLKKLVVVCRLLADDKKARSNGSK
jgi:hypothetical protein